MTDMVIGRDQNSVPNYSIPFSEVGYIINMSIGDTPTLVVPADVRFAFFQMTPGADVLVATDGAISAPTGSFAASEADLNPAVRTVTAGETLYFRAVTAAIVKVSFYRR